MLRRRNRTHRKPQERRAPAIGRRHSGWTFTNGGPFYPSVRGRTLKLRSRTVAFGVSLPFYPSVRGRTLKLRGLQGQGQIFKPFYPSVRGRTLKLRHGARAADAE